MTFPWKEFWCNVIKCNSTYVYVCMYWHTCRYLRTYVRISNSLVQLPIVNLFWQLQFKWSVNEVHWKKSYICDFFASLKQILRLKSLCFTESINQSLLRNNVLLFDILVAEHSVQLTLGHAGRDFLSNSIRRAFCYSKTKSSNKLM